MTMFRRFAFAFALTAALPATALAQTDLDTVRAGRFDTGRMWTFEYPPADYFSETYGFTADQAWFDRIRLSVLRIPGCSASFVSPNGLVATNHHCIRGTLSRIQREGESLLDDGFWAGSLDEERRIPNYYADRLLAVEDVSDRVFAAVDTATTEETRRSARSAVTSQIQDEMVQRSGGASNLRVEVIPLYNGGRYSAYLFERLSDVRMVGAVELQAGFFGGDPDNFTYPRYALDFAFLRVYGADGQPYQTDHYLGWGSEGVQEGDAVFVVGNPGPTSRLNTIAQLEYTRDVTAPVTVAAFEARLEAMRAFYAADPVRGDAMDLRQRMFGLSNSLKAWSGRLDALRDPVIMARKADFERSFAQAIRADGDLRDEYGDVIREIAELQQEKRELADRYGAFLLLGSGSGSVTLRRALAANRLIEAQAEGLPADSLDRLRQRLMAIGDWPLALERPLLAVQLEELRRYLGDASPITRQALRGLSADAAAEALLRTSVLADSARLAAAVADGLPRADDPAVSLMAAIAPVQREYAEEASRLATLERELNERLGRARFEVYGTDIPPDATFSPRITDGIVRGYPANGTVMPPYTSFFGMYDRHFSHADNPEWALPERFLPRPAELDLGTPLNFVSTADTYGGNSGSPAVTPDAELVGLNFDRNIEGLSRDFIYLPERGRNVMVDSRAVLEALDDVYDADRLVAELLTGRVDVAAVEAERLR